MGFSQFANGQRFTEVLVLTKVVYRFGDLKREWLGLVYRETNIHVAWAYGGLEMLIYLTYLMTS